MPCPHYSDYTRTCIQHFSRILEYSSFDVCESDDGYQNCLAFIALKSGFLCRYHLQCLEDNIKDMPFLVRYFIEDERTIDLFKDMVARYCSSEANHKSCACYKLFEQGVHPPVELMPDGQKLRLTDVLLKRKIVLK
jgi:hypothetical protein